MVVLTRNTTIRSADSGAIPAYVALPAVLPAPVVVIVAAVSGVDDGARAWADRYAERGFLTLLPNFFWRMPLSGPLRREDPDSLLKALERAAQFDHAIGQSDIASVRDFVQAMPECNGKWALAGYCFGGRYTLLAGAYMGADAVVAFHPSKMGVELEAAANVKCPTSFHFGGADGMVPMDVIEAVQTALKPNPRAETYVYPGVDHGFTTKGAPAFDAEVSEISFERALRVLDELKTPN
jgi:carboxymethylenebutenolidase